MLMAFLLTAVALFLLLRASAQFVDLFDPRVERFAIVACLILAFWLLHRGLVRLPFAAIGLRPLSEWGLDQRMYLAQVVPLAAVAFVLIFRGHLQSLLLQHGLVGFLMFSVVTGVLWGMAQEFLYRGWLQTELVRRYGTITGVLAANLVFTFGPLHWNHLLAGGASSLQVMLAIFCIGLLFGTLYQRSGNLWLPALLHGIWPLNMS